ncbi:helix-turn-helix domain-containing protein [Candidatus Woesearchaeota archaeon]|nr:helix-turn-helix domain-containing protein [Candidatus Woesearchaeota archaeon]
MENTHGEFCEIFGANPRNRIIEFFLEMRGLDFSIGDVARETGLNRATTYNTIEELVKAKYLILTRKVSGAQLYILNTEKEEVKVLINTFNMILQRIAEKYREKQKVVA